MTNAAPTRPGWYRARWADTELAEYLPHLWVCVHVADVTGRGCTTIRGLAAYSCTAMFVQGARSPWVELTNIAEWGERVVMPDEPAPVRPVVELHLRPVETVEDRDLESEAEEAIVGRSLPERDA